MTHSLPNGAVVLVGCGRLGSAILEGWLATSTVAPDQLIVLTPSDKPATEAARAAGVRINPPSHAFAAAQAVVLAVKPGKWRDALAPVVSLANSSRMGFRVCMEVSDSGKRASLSDGCPLW